MSKKLLKRLEEIKKLKQEGLTNEEIGKKYRVTGERIRQLLQVKKYCQLHKTYFILECEICALIEVYKRKVTKFNNQQLQDQLARLSIPLRTKEMVIQRAILIKFLRNVKEWKLNRIAKEMKKDFTSIQYLYRKYEKNKTI